MATYFSILAWEIPWTEEPGGLQSMGWQRVVHNSAAENGWTCWWVGFPLTKGSDPLLPPGAGGREEKTKLGSCANIREKQNALPSYLCHFKG